MQIRKDLKTGPFKKGFDEIKRLRGVEKENAITELFERINMYMIAEDFSEYYPWLYTKDVLKRIASASTNVEAENILISLRKRQGECLC